MRERGGIWKRAAALRGDEAREKATIGRSASFFRGFFVAENHDESLYGCVCVCVKIVKLHFAHAPVAAVWKFRMSPAVWTGFYRSLGNYCGTVKFLLACTTCTV